MKTIKTRVLVEGIKTLDRTTDVTKRAKNAYIRTKETSEETSQSNGASPTEYAANSIQNTSQTAAHKTVSTATRTTKESIDNIVSAKDRFKKGRNQQQIVEQRTRTATSVRPSARTTRATAGNVNSAGTATPKTARGLYKTANGVKKTAKGQVKTARRTVKTAARSGRMAIKTTQQSAKAAHKTAQATAKASKVAAKSVVLAVKKTIVLTKLAIKATIAAVKAIILAVKSLVAAIAAGGWIAVVVVLIICLIAFLLLSVFGIFFSGESNPETGQTINSVIAEIDDEFTEQIDNIVASNQHDQLDMSGSRALWKYVLAIYTVSTVTDPDNPMEVATMNDEKSQILRTVFWEMNQIHHEVVQYDVVMDELDEDGLPTGETYIETTLVLYIRIQGLTVEEASDRYGFDNEQRQWLEELLKPEYHSMWNALLFGITSIGDGTMIEIAESQIGNIGGEIYWRWYGFSSRVAWCACFVSWVADQAGFIDVGIMPKFSSTSAGEQWFRGRGQWQGRGYTPSPGDIIFFDWDGDGAPDHVGIVERVEGGTVHTIEGNSSDSVRRRNHSLDSNRILGYGVLA